MNCKNCIEGYKRITKNEAKKIHEEGKTIYFLPPVTNPFHPFTKLKEFPMGNFTDNINSILAYQLRELGRTVNFYIPL